MNPQGARAMNEVLTFRKATLEDIPLIQHLSHDIWHKHYPSVISVEQIEYMLPRMYGAEVLTEELREASLRYELIALGSSPIGYMSYRFELSSLFLSKLYLNPDSHGKGFGQTALLHVEEIARAQGATSIYLFVNKRNEKAIRAYLRSSFTIEQELVKDIGGGFVMDDYKMRKLFL